MAFESITGTALKELQSEDQVALLNTIDQLRSQGITRYVGGLPQLIVCGDQSSGKSSVLEAITRLKFPTKEKLCTTFATELALRRAPTTHITVRIEPSPRRHDSDRQLLLAFSATFSAPEEFPGVVDRARERMIGANSQQHDAIQEDCLCVEIAGPEMTPFTIVDLPGLIHTENERQTKDDVSRIKQLLKKYMDNTRSIILAIVDASHQIALQHILRMVRETDRGPQRTLGIITKPDTIRAGSETEIDFLRLARNESATYAVNLGWHVLKNRDHDNEDATADERDWLEKEFFAQGAWVGLPKTIVGIAGLRKRLSRILLDQIRTELPQLTNDISSALDDTRATLDRLGKPRASDVEQRSYLSNISSHFQSLVTSAVNGMYRDRFFDTAPLEGDMRKLRAVLQNGNDFFRDLMHTKGHRYHILHPVGQEQSHPGPISFSSTSASHAAVDELTPTPISIPYQDFLHYIDGLAKENRGAELPSSSNPAILEDLFRRQSMPWEDIASRHCREAWSTVSDFLETVLRHVSDEHTCNRLLVEHVRPAMDERYDKLESKLQELLIPYTDLHPSTWDARYVLKLRALQQSRSGTAGADTNSDEQTSQSRSEVVQSLSHGTSTAKYFQSAQILDEMNTYYEIAISTFIDNVALLGIEVCVISGLAKILAPEDVWQWSSEKINRIAAEPTDVLMERDHLNSKLRTLEEGLKTIKKQAIRVSDNSQRRDAEIRESRASPLATHRRNVLSFREVNSVSLQTSSDTIPRPRSQPPPSTLHSTPATSETSTIRKPSNSSGDFQSTIAEFATTSIPKVQLRASSPAPTVGTETGVIGTPSASENKTPTNIPDRSPGVGLSGSSIQAPAVTPSTPLSSTLPRSSNASPSSATAEKQAQPSTATVSHVVATESSASKPAENPKTGLFGSSTGFGASSNTAAEARPSTGLFGGTTTPAFGASKSSTGGGLFGSTVTFSTPPEPSSNTNVGGFGGFGSSANTDALSMPGTSPFGANNANPFYQPRSASPSVNGSGSLFGTSSTTNSTPVWTEGAVARSVASSVKDDLKNGTKQGIPPFHSDVERGYGEVPVQYQHISFLNEYREHSPEEIKLRDYDAIWRSNLRLKGKQWTFGPCDCPEFEDVMDSPPNESLIWRDSEKGTWQGTFAGSDIERNYCLECRNRLDIFWLHFPNKLIGCKLEVW